MKKILIITAVFTGLAAAGYSQERPRTITQERVIRSERMERTPEERARQYTAALDKRLNLSDKQEKEIYRMQLKKLEQRERMRRQQAKRHQKDLAELKADREASERKLNRILSGEQRAAYEKLRRDQREKMDARRDRMKKQMHRDRREPDRGPRKRGA